MAARTLLLKFAKLFGGSDSNIIWHKLVVVVCKMVQVCENPKLTQSRI
jgi:hypothetical protein